MGRTVTLMFRIIKDGKRRYCNPVWVGKKNPRIQPGYAVIDIETGKTEWHPEGVYCLRFEVDGKRRWETIGKDPEAALDRLAERSTWLRQMDRGTQPDKELAPAKRTLGLRAAIDKFIEHQTNLHDPKTARHYKFILNQFAGICTKQHVQDVEKQDLYDFAAWLRERGAADRTVANKVGDVVTLLRFHDVKDVTISYKYTEKLVKCYKEAEMKALFAACTDEEWLTFQFFFGTGFREREVMHACYNDLDFEDKTIMVRERLQLGFKPKDYEERTVPVADDLLELLQARREMRPKDWLIFPTEEGKPNGHFLRMLKERAFHAGLNCGHCVNRKGLSCKDHPVCELWILHRFRKSFASYRHENGFSARTIQRWLGHSDLQTTLKYLADVEFKTDRTRSQVNATFKMFKREED